MKSLVLCLAVLLVIISVSKCDISEEFNQKILDYIALLDCEQYETRSKDYSRFIPINHLTNVPSVDGYITRFPLFILGNQDARVVFSDVESPNWETNKGYEFGKFSYDYWGNTRVVIRNKKGNGDIAHLDVDLPPNNKTTKFLFEIAETGYINVYMNNGTEPIISAFDPEVLRVKYVSFSSAENKKTEYFYNCPSTLNDVLTPKITQTDDKNLANAPLNVLKENCQWFEARKWDESSVAYDIQSLSANIWDASKTRIEVYVVMLDAAIIRLSPQRTTGYQTYYEIKVLNGDEIRLIHRYGYYDSKWLATFRLPEFLIGTKQLKLIIDIFKDDGLVEVYTGPNDYRPVVSASNQNTGDHPVTVNYVSFTTEMTTRALHFYGCPTNNATTLHAHYDILPDDGFNKDIQLANQSCSSFYTGDRPITDYFPLTTLRNPTWNGYTVRVPFYITTAYYYLGSAHIIVTSGFDQVEPNYYNLTIGTLENKCVTIAKNDVILKKVLEPSILSRDVLNKFVFEITNDGEIRVFSDLNKSKPLLEYRDSEPINNLEFIAFGSAEVSITYYYKCNN